MRSHILKRCEKKKSELTSKLDFRHKNDLRPSVTMDEYQSVDGRKFMNCNLHHHESVPDNLGLKRARGSLPADKIKSLLNEHLSDFNVDLKSCAALVTDGAAVMIVLGRKLDCIHLQCMSHGINLSVTDIIFPKKKKKDDEDQETQLDFFIEMIYGSEINVDEDDTTVEIQLEHVDDTPEAELPDINPIYQEPVEKLRGISRKFHNSSKRKDCLEDILEKSQGKKVVIPLDVVTRWNSTKTMIHVALSIIEELELACKRQKIPWTLDDEDVSKLRELDEALSPLEEAINGLGAHGVGLLYAENIYQICYEELDLLNTDIARKLKQNFFDRVDSRRNPTLVHLLNFLSDPDYVSDNREDFFGHEINKGGLILEGIFNLVPSKCVPNYYPQLFNLKIS